MALRGFIKALAIAAAVWPVAARAQDYPSRAITVVVPFAAGGSFDTVGRIIAARMQELLGQPVVIENVGGAGGIVGVKRVIAAEPDGYTVLFGTIGTHAYNQTIYKKRRYDAVADFTPVTLWSEQPMVLETRKDLPANTLAEFAALLKANGGKMQYGSAGVGSTTHLGCALLTARLGRQRRACALSRRRPGGERSARRTARLLLRQPRWGGASDSGQAGESDSAAVACAVAVDAGPADGA